MLYYEFAIIVSFIITIIYLNMGHKVTSPAISNMFCLTPISNLGFYLLASATDINGALVANKITYLGACFLPLFTFQFILSICKIQKTGVLSTIAILFSSIVYVLVVTNDIHHNYYKKTSLLYKNGVAYMQKEYGPFHTVFYVMMFFFILLDIGVIIYGFKKKKDASVKSMVYLTALVSINIFSFIIGRCISPEIEVMPVVYIIDQIIYLTVEKRSELYNLQGVVSDALLERNELGYVAFDTKMNYLGSDEIMRVWFPEMENLRVDMKPDNSNRLYIGIKKLAKKVEELKEVKFVFQYKDKFYKVKGNHLVIDKKQKGYNFFIEDDTAEQLKISKVVYEKEHDAMTGLYNKGKYLELIEGEYQKLESIAIFNMDVNGLKEVNDNLGHEAGDKLISKTAKSIVSVQNDKIKGFRIGGDEFMLIGENLSKDEASELKEKWMNAVSELNKEDDTETKIACGMVYGEKGYVLSELLKEADKQMYDDKKRLKDSVATMGV